MLTLTHSDAIEFGEFGGAELFFADIDGDGQVEILAYQGPGIFGAAMYAHLPQVAAARPEHTCLSAFKKDGSRLWTFGEPNPPDKPYICHAHEACVAAGDADGDAAVEVALADGDRIYLLEGATGRLIAQTELERDNFFLVQILGEPVEAGEAAVVIKNGEDGYDGWRYGEPLVGLRPDLTRAWEPRAIPGAGHHMLPLDLDLDGRREFLVGYCMVKPSGEWRVIPDVIDPAALDADREHVDYTDVLPLGERSFVLGFAGSNKGYLVRNDGRTLFVKPDRHVQGAVLGRFREDSDYQLAIYNDDGPLVLYDPEGNEMWRVPTEERWPLGMPAACEGRVFHRNRPVVRLSLDKDYILFTDGGWPWAMDGEGRIAVEFAPPPESKQPEMDIPERARADDMGYGFGAQMVDWNGDGSLRAVIYDRRRLWVF